MIHELIFISSTLWNVVLMKFSNQSTNAICGFPDISCFSMNFHIYLMYLVHWKTMYELKLKYERPIKLLWLYKLLMHSKMMLSELKNKFIIHFNPNSAIKSGSISKFFKKSKNYIWIWYSYQKAIIMPTLPILIYSVHTIKNVTTINAKTAGDCKKGKWWPNFLKVIKTLEYPNWDSMAKV